MTQEAKAKEYADRIRSLLDAARKDGLAFTITGGRRTEYKLAVTVLPHTLDLNQNPETNPGNEKGN